MPFSSHWLSLREPADVKARDSNLLNKAALAAGEAAVVVDLGCGTGSNVRALAPLMPKDTTWHLVDNDLELLEIASKQLSGQVFTHCLDLADLGQVPLDGATLLTGSALLDLVSVEWFADLVAGLEIPSYFALSYNGEMSWSPADSRDASITESFNAHQKSDKGLGVAMGPDSVRLSSEILKNSGFKVLTGESNWELGPTDTELQAELFAGIAQAGMEQGNQEANDWLEARVLAIGKSYCTIGHEDILALPEKLESISR